MILGISLGVSLKEHNILLQSHCMPTKSQRPGIPGQNIQENQSNLWTGCIGGSEQLFYIIWMKEATDWLFHC